jgi:prevent-host-death family protein
VQINIYEAKGRLSELIDRANEDEEIIIARNGRPVARLVKYAQHKPPRRFGALAGRVRMADDFDAPLPDDLLAAFEGRL